MIYLMNVTILFVSPKHNIEYFSTTSKNSNFLDQLQIPTRSFAMMAGVTDFIIIRIHYKSWWQSSGLKTEPWGKLLKTRIASLSELPTLSFQKRFERKTFNHWRRKNFEQGFSKTFCAFRSISDNSLQKSLRIVNKAR